MDLTVSNLAVTRGGVPVLADVAFTLGPGQALILRGPNGIGKTTLLRTLAGLQPALAGRVSQTPENMAYAAHADGLKATLSVRENAEFWARIYGTSNVTEALERFDLSGLTNRLASNLSAGQKRRLSLARLLLTGRSIWVLDEPTVSLDTASVALFSAEIGRHLQTGGMALIATHIDLGLPTAQTLDLTQFRATEVAIGVFDEAFA